MFSWVFSRFDGSGDFLFVEAKRKVGAVEAHELEVVVLTLVTDGEPVARAEIFFAEDEQALGAHAQRALGQNLGGKGRQDFTIAIGLDRPRGRGVGGGTGTQAKARRVEGVGHRIGREGLGRVHLGQVGRKFHRRTPGLDRGQVGLGGLPLRRSTGRDSRRPESQRQQHQGKITRKVHGWPRSSRPRLRVSSLPRLPSTPLLTPIMVADMTRQKRWPLSSRRRKSRSRV